jgi:hypothetical protein
MPLDVSCRLQAHRSPRLPPAMSTRGWMPEFVRRPRLSVTTRAGWSTTTTANASLDNAPGKLGNNIAPMAADREGAAPLVPRLLRRDDRAVAAGSRPLRASFPDHLNVCVRPCRVCVSSTYCASTAVLELRSRLTVAPPGPASEQTSNRGQAEPREAAPPSFGVDELALYEPRTKLLTPPVGPNLYITRIRLTCSGPFEPLSPRPRGDTLASLSCRQGPCRPTGTASLVR